MNKIQHTQGECRVEQHGSMPYDIVTGKPFPLCNTVALITSPAHGCIDPAAVAAGNAALIARFMIAMTHNAPDVKTCER